MGKWKIHGCPKCGGSLVVDKDENGWYEQCINCSYLNDLEVLVHTSRKPLSAETHAEHRARAK